MMPKTPQQIDSATCLTGPRVTGQQAIDHQAIDQQATNQRGFTLVELLIAMLILTIGIMAILSMQFTALGSAMASRDNSNAADIAQRIMHIMRVEGQQWRSSNVTMETAVGTDTHSDSAFESTPLLLEVAASTSTFGNFAPLFAQALDARMSTRGVTRYCAYGRGRRVSEEIHHIQIAVFFPAANGTIEGNDCTAAAAEFTLDPSLTPEGDGTHAQRNGYRVQYFDTQIVRRGHLL
jgi:type IV pilus modification protein PilV